MEGESQGSGQVCLFYMALSGRWKRLGKAQANEKLEPLEIIMTVCRLLSSDSALAFVFYRTLHDANGMARVSSMRQLE